MREEPHKQRILRLLLRQQIRVWYPTPHETARFSLATAYHMPHPVSHGSSDVPGEGFC